MNRKPFFDKLHATLFERGMTQRQVAGIELILDAWEAYGPVPRAFVAYSLATTYWETAFTMQPIAEYGRGRGRAYGQPAGPFNKIYYGRGFVQLTWLRNYERADVELHKRRLLDAKLNLVRDPDLVMTDGIAANIMILGMVEGWFTGKKLSDYFTERKSDWVGARRIINGTDKAKEIAAIAKKFDAALAAGAVIMKPPSEITEKDLREVGSDTIAGGDRAQNGVLGQLAGTVLGGTAVTEIQGKVSDKVSDAVASAPEAVLSSGKFQAWAHANWPVLLLFLAIALIVYFNWHSWTGAARAKRARLREARAGLNLSRLA